VGEREGVSEGVWEDADIVNTEDERMVLLMRQLHLQIAGSFVDIYPMAVTAVVHSDQVVKVVVDNDHTASRMA
jgi:hypothetical protein